MHVRITNTRITDPESLKRRHPCILREFSIRTGSGGAGLHHGGDSVVRDIEFRRDVNVSVLSGRRAVAPYGMCGGGPGQCGKNVWVWHVEHGEREMSLRGKNRRWMKNGGRIIIRKLWVRPVDFVTDRMLQGSLVVVVWEGAVEGTLGTRSLASPFIVLESIPVSGTWLLTPSASYALSRSGQLSCIRSQHLLLCRIEHIRTRPSDPIPQ
jgi:hypothetical protein